MERAEESEGSRDDEVKTSEAEVDSQVHGSAGSAEGEAEGTGAAGVPGEEEEGSDAAGHGAAEDGATARERDAGGEGSPPPDRCGYVFDIDSNLTEDRSACCWRRTYDDTGRCRWHLDREKDDLITAPLHLEGERLGEPILREASLAGEQSLAGRKLAESDLSGSDLRHADLSGTDLTESDLSGADLRSADLTNAVLERADLSGANLWNADLTEANARGASFEDANLENTTLTLTNLRDVDLHDARLYEAVFSDTWVNEGTTFDRRAIYERDPDIDFTHEYQTADRFEAAAWTYRALEYLCRDNALPELSRWFHNKGKDARRRHAWAAGNYPYAVKAETSRWVMGYGSNPWRVLATSALVIVVCAALYPLAPSGGIKDVDGTTISYTIEGAARSTINNTTVANGSGVAGSRFGSPTDLTNAFLKSLYFSIVTFATLGYGDIQPVGKWARALATVETILGSLLLALLVFVLSRHATW